MLLCVIVVDVVERVCAGAGGSGSGGGGSGQAGGASHGGGGGGLRIFTTQIREWEVEASADHVSIIVITDYGKYRLLR